MDDLEIDELERIWTDSVVDFGLQHYPWIADMYARKHSWSNAHILKKFFAGLKITLRCEALNMQISCHHNDLCLAALALPTYVQQR
ncbi:hypothetical protein Ahy_A06g027637 [Arachis hypogaea]|uniref:Protein FAR1-RELATED SEQUENCE n=1 Tax=Arachis hypogaea TaxID=3818 RepID=A0A445CPA1_ARAHY|nr:hypothetical protein Ahy_A06g027637 [Arachis hypogaea]